MAKARPWRVERGGLAARQHLDGSVLAGHPGVDVRVALAGCDRAERHAVAGHRPGGHVPVARVRHHDDRAPTFGEDCLKTACVRGHVLDMLRDPFLREARGADHLDGVLENVGEREDSDTSNLFRGLVGEHLSNPRVRARALETEEAHERPGRTARERTGQTVGDCVHDRARRAERGMLEPCDGRRFSLSLAPHAVSPRVPGRARTRSQELLRGPSAGRLPCRSSERRAG